MEKRHFNRKRCLVAAVAAVGLSAFAYNANATLSLELVPSGGSPDGADNLYTLPSNAPTNFDVWATVTGSGSGRQGLQIAGMDFLSTGSLLGDYIGAMPISPWNSNGAQAGTPTNLDGDGDLDLGSTNAAVAAGHWIAISDDVQGNPANATTYSVKLGTIQWDQTTGSGSTLLKPAVRATTSGALWFEDATVTNPGGGNPLVWSNDKNQSNGTITAFGLTVSLGVVGTPNLWALSGNGSMGIGANWDDGVVPAANQTLTFAASNQGANVPVTVDAPGGGRSVSGLIFNNASSSFNLGGSNSLTINAGSAIDVQAGSHTISAPMVGSGTITKSGPGTIAVSGTQTWAANSNLAVTAGTFNHASNSGTNVNFGVGDGFPDTGDEIPATANLSVNVTGGTYAVNASQNLKAMTVATGTNTDRSPSNGGTGDGSKRIQIGDNQRVRVYDNGTNDAVDPSRATAERLWRSAIAGYYDDVNFNGGQGDGTIGGGEFGNGIFLNGVTNTSVNGLGLTLVGDGNNFENTLEMREMILGDLNGDNSVGPSDGGIFASFFGNAPAGFGFAHYTWMEGDLNGDGAVTPADGGIFAGNFGSTFNPSNASGGVTAVPEPASLALLGIGATALVGRRRRKA